MEYESCSSVLDLLQLRHSAMICRGELSVAVVYPADGGSVDETYTYMVVNEGLDTLNRPERAVRCPASQHACTVYLRHHANSTVHNDAKADAEVTHRCNRQNVRRQRVELQLIYIER